MKARTRFVPRWMLVVFVVLLGMLAVATPRAEAQTSTAAATAPTIVANGTGEAGGPATAATFQVILASQSEMYGYGGEFAIDEPDAPCAGTCVDATPVASAGASDGGYSAYPPASGSGDVEAGLPAVVAVITAAGVAEGEIETVVPAFTSAFAGPGGPGGAQLRFTIDKPTADGLSQLVQDVMSAATSSGLAVQHIGVSYTSADCDALQQDARVAAVADAKKRAEGLATALGVTLGDLVQAADLGYYGPFGDGSGGCGPANPTNFVGYGEELLPVFDADSASEVTVYAQIALTYAIAA